MSPLLSTRANASALGYRSLVAGAATSFESIATVGVGSGGAANVEFTSIPGTYTHLQLRAYALPNGNNNFGVTFNNDTAANYSTHQLQGDGASASALGASSTNSMFLLGLYTDSSSYAGVTIIDILDYANTNKYKTIRALSGQDGNATGTATDWRVTFGSGNWRSTNAVTSIKISSPSWRQYSHFALYGIRSA